ncbi:MAG: hypothetical protein WA902_11575 [Thermosynechococcaceae cyanobacterium]
MAKVVSPLLCRVEAIGKPRESSYEAGTYYYPTLFMNLSQPDGSETAKVWKNLSGDEVSQLMKGDQVQLVPAGQDRNGKPKHNILLVNGSQSAPPDKSDESGQLQTETKQAIASYVQEMSKLYRYCWGQAANQLGGMATEEESVRCAASSLFIAAKQKFSI